MSDAAAMEQDPDEPIPELRHAQQIVFSPARPALVAVGRSAPANPSREQERPLHVASPSNPPTRRRAPRVLLTRGEDRWSTVANPECPHDQHCGHLPRPRLVFRPDGAEPRQQGAGMSTLAQTSGAARGANARNESSDELPSKLGPFLLKSQSTGSSAVHGSEYCFLLNGSRAGGFELLTRRN